MISKKLALAAAIVLLSGLGAAPVLAQGAPNQSSQPAATAPAGGTDATATPPAQATPPAPAPAAAPPAVAGSKEVENPYGIQRMWATGDIVLRGVLVLLGIMSIGTWYIFFTKFWEQSRMLGQASQVEKRFWSSNNLNEGIDKLAKNSVFRAVAESGVRAASTTSGGLTQSDWIGMALTRQLDEVNAKLQGGIAFLASVGSTAPFVGLFGTVWGILNALLAIGVSGQPSIDKVAGPVGQALIATAIGLFVAVPAVMLYNLVVRRNKVINEKLKAFAGDLQTYLVTKGK